MKHVIVSEILRHLSGHPKYRRRLKILAFAGIFLFVGVLGLTVWAGVGAYRMVTEVASQVSLSEQVQSVTSVAQQMTLPEQVESVQQKLNALPVASCWNQAQNLMQLSPWVTTPLGQIFTGLKNACWGESDPSGLTDRHHSDSSSRESI